MLQKKVCILGPTGVGKTSLIKQYVEGIFSEKYQTSIGVKIDKKLVSSGYTPVQLMIWDLEGIDEYCGFNPRYLRGASALVLVCDQTRFSSLAQVMNILSICRNHSDIPAILALNKNDLVPATNWDDTELQKHASKFKDIFLTSAKTGSNVGKMFDALANIVTH